MQTSQNVPYTDKHFSSYMPQPKAYSMFLEQVEPLDIISSVRKLKPKCSTGHDGFSTKIMKETIEYILEPITYRINKSFNTGIFPQEMKTAKVIPIYKSSDKTLIQNYRPVSLLPAFSKLIEKLMYKKMNVISKLKQHSLQTSIGLPPKTLHYASNHLSTTPLCKCYFNS